MAEVTYTYPAPSGGKLLHVKAGKGGMRVVSLCVAEMSGAQLVNSSGLFLRLDEAEHMAKTILRIIRESGGMTVKPEEVADA